MANIAYPEMSPEQGLRFVRNFGAAVNALWNLELPETTMLGGLVAKPDRDSTEITIGPERQNDIGGPHESDFLRSYIRQRLRQSERQEYGVEEFKSKYLQSLQEFVRSGMPNVPAIVEKVPIVLAHTDMRSHNVIVSEDDPTEIVAIIDWELSATFPFVGLEPLFDNLFHQPSFTPRGPEYPGAAELREAFWSSMPKWSALKDTEAAKVFREWHRFGELLNASPRPPHLEGDEKDSFWNKNVRVIESVFAKWPQ
jgi:hypothetical protein